jgi:acyl-CoA synthetase (AMP-forming)/AMP-acid ligase II
MDIGQMVEQSAARFGDSLAVACVAEDATRTHTFSSLDAASNRTANGFLDAGIGFGDPVAVLSHNSIAFVEAFFATQKTGARVTPINVRFDAADVKDVLDDTEPRCLLADPALLAGLDGIEAFLDDREIEVITTTDHPAYRDRRSYDDLTAASADPPGVGVGPEAVDGYFYTSGSSGRPKGVVHTHADRVLTNLNVIAEFGLRHNDVNCCPLPLFHAGPLYTGFVPFLQFGVPTVLLERFDPVRTLDAVAEWDVTVLGGVPAQYERLADTATNRDHDLDSLRFWWVSGAPLAETLRERCREELCGTHSIVYGATEVGPPASILPPEASAERPDSCGTGQMGQRVRIVNPDGANDPTAAVEPGKTGELVVRGETVMERYLHRPDETDAVLVDGWFFTGDLARRDAAGYLSIEGRTDDMITSGGENVYPAEIETVLRDHPAIEDIAVLGVDHDEWGRTPKAFVVASDGAAMDEAAIARYCLESRLADYKRPREVAFVQEIPRNPSGGSVLRGELRDGE